jgi:hypothetical protein
MAALAVVQRERDTEMAHTAELVVQILVHGEMFGCFFLDVEDIGVALRAFKPLRMRLMRKYGR